MPPNAATPPFNHVQTHVAQAHEYKKKEIQKQTNQKIENSSTSKEISELSSLNDGRAPAFLKKKKRKEVSG
jgi:hypothetical protein